MWPGMCVTSRTASVGWDLKSQLVEIVTWVRPDEFVHYRHHACCGADGNVVIERLCFSLPYVEKPFNSKVIKSFIPELRSRKCFLSFGIPMLSICELWTLWTFCVLVWICIFHIFISWLCNIQIGVNNWAN